MYFALVLAVFAAGSQPAYLASADGTTTVAPADATGTIAPIEETTTLSDTQRVKLGVIKARLRYFS
jgi:hypothetical protein